MGNSFFCILWLLDLNKFAEAEAMAGRDDLGLSEKTSIEAANDVPTFNAENMQNNIKVVYYWLVSTPPCEWIFVKMSKEN